MTMMNEEQRVEAIAEQMKEDETNAIKLYTDWCSIKGDGYLPRLTILRGICDEGSC